ncbi:hypothetical protein [Pseudomonas oryzihabitans]|uniref:hypothetical protein n=1 Tax=Pseudomonas oryzihabitans TaxID=47885 RepID=UPI002894B1ED|nr:hypothetical protein [Pseudomonas oryzihabitans]MDT3721686.1 hypothetical protein [Pseudomonas oryzihabitans]
MTTSSIPRSCLLAAALLMMPLGFVQAAIPSLKPTASCVRSAFLLHCRDGQGGWYGVAVQGNDTLMRGFDAASGLTWAQTSTRLGRLQFFSGLSSDGNLWLGRTRQLGWNVISRFSTSQGDRARTSCNRVAGCEWR